MFVSTFFDYPSPGKEKGHILPRILLQVKWQYKLIIDKVSKQ